MLGEAGMGKSVVVDWVLTRAETDEFRCARVTGRPRMPPLWPWRRALDGTAVTWSRRFDSTDSAAGGRELVAAEVVEGIGVLAREGRR